MARSSLDGERRDEGGRKEEIMSQNAPKTKATDPKTDKSAQLAELTDAQIAAVVGGLLLPAVQKVRA